MMAHLSVFPNSIPIYDFGALRCAPKSRAANRGGFQAGGLPHLDSSVLICSFLSLFVTFPICFRDFPPYFWDLPDLLFSSFSAYSQHLHLERVHDTIRTFPEKKWEPPRFETPPGLEAFPIKAVQALRLATQLYEICDWLWENDTQLPS